MMKISKRVPSMLAAEWLRTTTVQVKVHLGMHSTGSPSKSLVVTYLQWLATRFVACIQRRPLFLWNFRFSNHELISKKKDHCSLVVFFSLFSLTANTVVLLFYPWHFGWFCIRKTGSRLKAKRQLRLRIEVGEFLDGRICQDFALASLLWFKSWSNQPQSDLFGHNGRRACTRLSEYQTRWLLVAKCAQHTVAVLIPYRDRPDHLVRLDSGKCASLNAFNEIIVMFGLNEFIFIRPPSCSTCIRCSPSTESNTRSIWSNRWAIWRSTEASCSTPGFWWKKCILSRLIGFQIATLAGVLFPRFALYLRAFFPSSSRFFFFFGSDRINWSIRTMRLVLHIRLTIFFN